jgi:hypothetical protein
LRRVSTNDPAPLTASNNIDDAGLQRTSVSKIVFEQGFEYSIPRDWEVITSGAGAVILDNLQRSLILSIGTTSGDRVVVQRKAPIHWRYGYSMMFNFTVVLNYLNIVMSGGSKVRVGLFDDNNGLFLELSALGVFVVFRTSITGSVTDVKIPQSSWANDKLDGTGSSGALLAWNKVQRPFGSASSPGGGRGRFGFFVKDRFVQCTQISSINSRTSVPFLRTSDLPPRMELINDGAAGSGLQSQWYSTSMWEEGPTSGAGIETGYISACGRGSDFLTTNCTDYTPMMSVRLVDQMNGLEMHGHLLPLIVQAMSLTDGIYHIVVIENATLTGANFQPIDAVNSIVELDTAASAIIAGTGTVVFSAYGEGRNIGKATSFELLDSKVLLARAYGGASDHLTVAIKSVAGAHKAAVEMVIKEIF